MSFIQNVERKGLFKLTRYIALLFICLLVLSVIVGFFNTTRILGQRTNTKIIPKEILSIIEESSDSKNAMNVNRSEEEINLSPGIMMPENLRKYFVSPDNRRVLRGWLELLPTDKSQDFLNNLSEIMKEGEAKGIDPGRLINTYKSMKLARFRDEKTKSEEFKQKLMYFIGGIVGVVFLIAMLSLILVLLAIERNTRHDPQAATIQ